VLIPVFDPQEYDSTRGSAGGPTIKIVNFVGFFVGSGTDTSKIQGNLATYAGTVDAQSPVHAFVPYENAFLRTVVLIR
jgi:hypothetical protein